MISPLPHSLTSGRQRNPYSHRLSRVAGPSSTGMPLDGHASEPGAKSLPADDIPSMAYHGCFGYQVSHVLLLQRAHP